MLDDFDGPALDEDLWLRFYLPQWSSRARTRPRYRLEDGCLVLVIAPDQEPWCPELDGDVRVSNVQTGVFSGPLGSAVGQHRFSPRAVVREEQAPRRTLLPQYGLIEIRARAVLQPGNVAAFWLIGYEEDPRESAELCVVEIKGTGLAPGSTTVGCGIRAFADPSLVDDFSEVPLPVDVDEFHVYSADWRPEGVVVAVDGRVIHRTSQSPAYPLQLMLNIYDLAPADAGPQGPMEFWVDWVRIGD